MRTPIDWYDSGIPWVAIVGIVVKRAVGELAIVERSGRVSQSLSGFGARLKRLSDSVATWTWRFCGGFGLGFGYLIECWGLYDMTTKAMTMPITTNKTRLGVIQRTPGGHLYDTRTILNWGGD